MAGETESPRLAPLAGSPSFGAILPGWRLSLRVLIMLGAMALAAQIQSQITSGKDTVFQLIAYLVAGALFAVALPEDALMPASWLAGARSAIESDGLKLTPSDAANLALTVAVQITALYLFWTNHLRGVGFALWWLAMISYVGVFGPRRVDPRALVRRRPSRPQVVYALVAAAILVGVTAVTFYRLDSIPYGLWWDEANFGLYAQTILHHQVDFPFLAPFGDPALEFYFHALEQLVFGPTQFATRFLAATCGVAGVVLLGLLAARLWNRWFALVAMAVLGFMRWHLNFSRFGIHEMVFQAFELAVVLMLVLALRDRKPIWFALCGVLLGLSLHIYFPAWGLVGLVVIATLYGLTLLRPRLQPSSIGLLVIGLALAYSPLLEAGIQNPDLFNGRAKEVSIFSSANDKPPLQALLSNLHAHALMFNVDGDRNGRHNIPGQPQLDTLEAILFVLGLAWAVYHARRPQYAFLILWFLAMMAPGVVSLDFEAPQSGRAAGAQVPVALFIAIALWGYGSMLIRALSPPNLKPTRTAWFIPLLLAPLLLGVAVTDVGAYFDAEQNNESVWELWATDLTFVGRELNTLPPAEQWYVSPQLANQPPVTYLAPGRGNGLFLNPSLNLPFSSPQPVAVFLARDDSYAFPLFKSYYPHGTFRVLQGPSKDTPPLAYEARISRADIQSTLGLNLTYRMDGQTVSTHVSGLTLPAGLHRLPADMEWHGGIQIPMYTRSTLTISAPGHIVVLLDRNPLCSGDSTVRCTETWAPGNHSLTIRLTSGTGAVGAGVHWTWSGGPTPTLFDSPFVGHGLAASYYPNAHWAGRAALVQMEPYIGYYYQVTPLGRPFSVRWRGSIWAPSTGTYMFTLGSIDDSWLTIDGGAVAHKSPALPGQGSIRLQRGWHRIDVRLQAINRYTQIYLSWTTPGKTAPVPVPSQDFRP